MNSDNQERGRRWFLIAALATVEFAMLGGALLCVWPIPLEAKAQVGDTLNAVAAFATAPTLLLLGFQLYLQRQELRAQDELQRESLRLLNETVMATRAPFMLDLLREWRGSRLVKARQVLTNIEIVAGLFEILKWDRELLNPASPIVQSFPDGPPDLRYRRFREIAPHHPVIEKGRELDAYGYWEHFYRHRRTETMLNPDGEVMSDLVEFLVQVERLVEMGYLGATEAVEYFGGAATAFMFVCCQGVSSEFGRLEGFGGASKVASLAGRSAMREGELGRGGSIQLGQPAAEVAPG